MGEVDLDPPQCRGERDPSADGCAQPGSEGATRREGGGGAALEEGGVMDLKGGEEGRDTGLAARREGGGGTALGGGGCHGRGWSLLGGVAGV